MIFLFPFIVFYEFGTFYFNTEVLNNTDNSTEISQKLVTAFVWMQKFLESVGFGGKFAWAAPPLAVIVILLSLQITSRKQWNFWFYDFFLMVVECVLLAVPLIVLALFVNSAGTHRMHSQIDISNERQVCQLPACSSIESSNMSTQLEENNKNIKEPVQPLMAKIVTGIGAGIYEEFVFRLILICILMVLFQDLLRMSHTNSIVLSILIAAALFSAYHHVDFLSGRPNIEDPFNVTEFAFRTMAGVYFAILYAIRGFGITAGVHAFYNIIVVTFFSH